MVASNGVTARTATGGGAEGLDHPYDGECLPAGQYAPGGLFVTTHHAEAAASRLARDVDALARSDRPVGSPGHAAARAYLTDRLAEVGATSYAGDGFALPYGGDDGRFANLIGVIPGTDRTAAPVLLAAHYDTVPGTPGADDNAAAVTLSLEVARRLRTAPATRNVVIALFDAEEPPYFHSPLMGSTCFVSDQLRARVHAAVVLDLVGHALPVPGLEDLVFVTGAESDPGLVPAVRARLDDGGVRLVTALNHYVGDMSDHHAFRLAKMPYLFLTCGRWPHYHAPSDTPDRLDLVKLAHLTDTVEALVRDVATRTLEGPWEGHDTTDLDVATMRAALGPLLDGHGLELRDRSDVDRVVGFLMGQMGL